MMTYQLPATSNQLPFPYEWDHENRLTRAIHPDGTQTTFTYCKGCSLGLLAEKTRPDGTTVQWVWDGMGMVKEVAGSWLLVAGEEGGAHESGV